MTNHSQIDHVLPSQGSEAPAWASLTLYALLAALVLACTAEVVRLACGAG